MTKSNEQIEDVLDELSVLKDTVLNNGLQLAKVESLLAQLVQTKESDSAGSQAEPLQTENPYLIMRSAAYDGIASYCVQSPFLMGLLSEKNVKIMGDTYTKAYMGIFQKKWASEADEKKRKREEYLQKRDFQGIGTIDQVAEWAPEYPSEIQRTLRYLGWRIINEDESPENTHKILKVWGDALKCITNPSSIPPPTLKSWLRHKWYAFKKRTDKWGMFQWYLVILCVSVGTLSAYLYQKSVMDLDRTNRIFYQKVILNEKRKKDYQELDSLIHSDSFFKTYWTLDE